MAEPRILFVHNYPTHFVKLDLALLSSGFDCTERYADGWNPNPGRIFQLVHRHDLVFTWFASWHSLLPLLFARLLGKPSILVIGGYDTACMPEIGYGHQRGGIRKWASRCAMRLATQLVTNSWYSRDEAIRNAGIDAARIEVIHHGVDGAVHSPATTKQRQAVTVGNVNSGNLARKGLMPFALAAHLLPEVPFLIVGRWFDEAADRLREAAPPNLHLIGYLPDGELHTLLARSKVYVQASRHEGFGLAMAEAMLHGCIPVVSGAGAIPEVVGNAGVYLPSWEPEAVAGGIRLALDLDDSHGDRARRQILQQFPLEKRRQGLKKIVVRVWETSRRPQRF